MAPWPGMSIADRLNMRKPITVGMVILVTMTLSPQFSWAQCHSNAIAIPTATLSPQPLARPAGYDEKTPGKILPTLLTADFYRQNEVCHHAQKNSPNKKVAIVLMKSHLCHSPVGAYCIDASRLFAAPHLIFLKEHFALYHSRLTRPRRDENFNVVADTTKGYWKIAKEWRFTSQHPELVFLDLQNCKVFDQFKLDTNLIVQATRDRTDHSFEFYQKIRSHILQSSTLVQRLGAKILDPETIDEEWKKASIVNQTARMATRKEIETALDEQKQIHPEDIEFPVLYGNADLGSEEEAWYTKDPNGDSELNLSLPVISFGLKKESYFDKDVMTELFRNPYTRDR